MVKDAPVAFTRADSASCTSSFPCSFKYMRVVTVCLSVVYVFLFSVLSFLCASVTMFDLVIVSSALPRPLMLRCYSGQHYGLLVYLKWKRVDMATTYQGCPWFSILLFISTRLMHSTSCYDDGHGLAAIASYLSPTCCCGQGRPSFFLVVCV